MPLIDTEKAWKTAQRIYSDPVLLHAIKNVLSSTEIIEAYTGGQISEIIRKAEEERAENRPLRIELEFLKNCINCKIRNTCPRHCGKVVHGCDHWEYGDPMKEAAPVVDVGLSPDRPQMPGGHGQGYGWKHQNEAALQKNGGACK